MKVLFDLDSSDYYLFIEITDDLLEKIMRAASLAGTEFSVCFRVTNTCKVISGVPEEAADIIEYSHKNHAELDRNEGFDNIWDPWVSVVASAKHFCFKTEFKDGEDMRAQTDSLPVTQFRLLLGMSIDTAPKYLSSSNPLLRAKAKQLLGDTP